MDVRRTLAGLIAAPLLVAALAACGHDSSVANRPISRDPSPTSPTTKPHHEPPEHFIRRWAAAEKHMENTGDTHAYLGLSHGCRACRQLVSDIHRFYAHGGYVHWGGWRILSITHSASGRPGLVFVVKVDSLPTTYRESSSGAIKRLSGGPATHQLTLRRIGGGWVLTQKAQLAT
jgi:hypothetical protein